MGNLPLKECYHNGCRELTTGTYCTAHTKKAWDEVDKTRGTRTQRGYDNRWLRAREQYLRDNPFCAHCRSENVRTLAEELDHVIAHRGDMVIFWNRANWQGLCKYHHRIKTAKESKQ